MEASEPRYPADQQQPSTGFSQAGSRVPIPASQPGTLMVAPKNPTLHLLVSFFLPGVGSMLNGEVGKGLAILISYIVCWLFFWLIVPLFVAFAVWIFGLVDAFQGATKWNLARGIVS